MRTGVPWAVFISKARPCAFYSSSIRPAANKFIREYLRRLHGGSWEPIHPLLKDVLEETFGIMVYQEDVSRVAMALAGFSPAEADALRKELSKKDRKHELQDSRQRFQEGVRNHGLAEEQIARIWKMMMSFGGYSFCKPHSASYARVSFQAAYLKVHYPAEFMAAVISNGGGFYGTFAYVSEARALIQCGALDGFDSTNNRATLMWQLAVWLKMRAQKTARTGSLFENKTGPSRTPP